MKNGIGIILIAILFSFTPPNSFAQDSEPQEVPLRMIENDYWGVGAQAGITTGAGLNLRYLLKNRFGFELTGGVLSIGKTLWSLGGEIQFRISSAYDHRLYALCGMSYNAFSDDSVSNRLDTPTRAGIGMGYEWFWTRNVAIGTEILITGFLGRDSPLILPLPQFHLTLYFE